MTQPERPTDPATPATRQGEVLIPGEVLISGLDTGPTNEERHNLTPTEDHARFQPQFHPAQEPADEDA